MMEEDCFEWAWPIGAGAEHIYKRQLELTGLLSSRIPIFLDTNFWVMARQAAFGETTDRELISMLGALRLAVESGQAFFPVTSDLIGEFSKQSPDRLAATMAIVDHLSLGVAMVPHHERTRSRWKISTRVFFRRRRRKPAHFGHATLSRSAMKTCTRQEWRWMTICVLHWRKQLGAPSHRH
jgi:hypothetical protein